MLTRWCKINKPDMTQPIRVQRKRTKGFKLPENTVCVTRGTKFGNPFKIGNFYQYGNLGFMSPCSPDSIAEANKSGKYIFISSNEDAVFHYEKYITGLMYPRNFKELKGKNLACFCKDGDVCHADILLKLANEPEPIDLAKLFLESVKDQ